MKNVRALIVGVGRYYLPGWKTDGPLHNAVAMARWLLDNGVPPEQVHLFTDTEGLRGDETAILDAARIIARPPDYQDINRFWRTDLPGLAQQGDRLFVYWSGHGMTDAYSDRLFFCGDYSDTLTTSVFNMTEFLGVLRSSPFRRFESQLLFADVCGTYANSPVNPTRGVAPDPGAVNQLSVFATPDGEYAEMSDRSGQFTDTLLEVLGAFKNTWPDESPFLSALDAMSRRTSFKPFALQLKGRHTERPLFRVGAGLRERPAYAEEAYLMIGRHAASARGVWTRHFERTMAGLGHTRVARATTLLTMIDQLSDLQDARDGVAPYGLVEFLVRLVNDPALDVAAKEDMGAWIATYGADRRLEAEERLRKDLTRLKLLLEVKNDDAGNLSELVCYLRYDDLTPVPEVQAERCSVRNWRELCDTVVSRVEIASQRAHASRSELELHFLADAPLLDLWFHNIPMRDGLSLGEAYVCIVHSLHRARAADASTVVRRWRAWEQSLRAEKPAELPLQALPAGPPFPSTGICYACYPPGKIQVHRLIQLGVPLLCWPHAATTEAEISGELKTLADSDELAALPNILFDRRLRGNPVSTQVSMLWDEWNFRPFLMTDGVG